MSEEIDLTSILVERVYGKFAQEEDLEKLITHPLMRRLAEVAVQSLKNDGALVGHPILEEHDYQVAPIKYADPSEYVEYEAFTPEQAVAEYVEAHMDIKEEEYRVLSVIEDGEMAHLIEARREDGEILIYRCLPTRVEDPE